MVETTMSDAVLARLEALTARLEAVETLEVRIAGLEAENARLTASLSPPTATLSPLAPATTSRRGMLRRVLGASAAAALLLVARESATAEAAARATILGAPPAAWGLAAVDGGGEPGTFLGNLGVRTFGVIGVWEGTSITPPANAGVLGQGGRRVGVIGSSDDSVGVQGISTNNAGVYGQGPYGVFATGTGQAAIYGANNAGFGAWGNSAFNIGVYGSSTTNVGVRAESTQYWALHAKSPNYAGVFEGNVYVTGQMIALGGVFGASGVSARAAGDGTLAEDVGEATLVNGKATVALDKAFSDEVDGRQYQVFVTPHDVSGRPLAVVARRRDGFDVQELAGGGATTNGARPSGGTFSYRVVARRPAPTGTRAAPLAPPDFTTVKPAPEPPKAPEPSGASDERRPR